MKLRITFVFIALFATAFIWGCSDKKPTASNPNNGDSTNTTTWNSAGYWEARDLNASRYDSFIYYSFSKKDTVYLTSAQAATDSTWDIAFKRTNINLDGGVSGLGHIKAVDLASLGRTDSTDFMAFNNPALIPDSAWTSDSYSLVINEWYRYSHNPFSLSPSRYVYIMKDANSNYVKFQIIGIDNPGMPPNMGTISIQYIYAGTSPNFTGAPDTLTFDANGGGSFYVDFSAGALTHPTDPRSSTDWDLEFNNYDIHQNGGVFGSGHGTTYEVWQDQHDSTSFDETSVAPTNSQPYFSDSFGSVMADWYNYIEETHEVLSKNHVYVISSGGHNYKMQIEAYYKHDTGTSGYYTIKWLELQ